MLYVSGDSSLEKSKLIFSSLENGDAFIPGRTNQIQTNYDNTKKSNNFQLTKNK